MNNNDLFNKLIEYKFITPTYKYLNKFIIEPFMVCNNIIRILSLYYIYICDGSSCMPIDKEILKDEWNRKCESVKIMLISKTDDIREHKLITNEIDEINNELSLPIDNIDELISCTSLVGFNKLFYIDNGFLFTRQYYEAKNGIKKSIERLFIDYRGNDALIPSKDDIKKLWATAADKQIDIITKGAKNNIIVTGGPGTGKTTAVFYLLLWLIKEHKNYNVYLTAPSGKASERIRESIIDEIDKFKTICSNDYLEALDIISKAKEYTIHRLLETDYNTNGFKRNKDNQFDKNSIFIIDESSMIDICIFNSLLNAIPNGARVFILGDKNQLPSVECGAVLSDLLAYKGLNDYIVELEESHRFKKGSEIYELSKKVNNNVELENIDWKETEYFKIIKREEEKYPVFYYDDSLCNNSKDNINKIILEWAEHFYKDNYKNFSDIDFTEESLEKIYKNIDEARVLCAENDSKIGVSTINKIINDSLVKSNKINHNGYYQGTPIMITENNKVLELYNGDTGIIVKFKNSKILYLVIKKNTEKYVNDSTELKDGIMKLGDYMIYPLRMLDLKNTILAYAITIHKSQGSGYDNIMVILPKKEGHPLLNKQILYTAITRTKGPTYIISNTERMNESIRNSIKRYTRIFD